MRPLTVHTEMVWLTFPRLLRLVKKVRAILFVLTPVNYEYAVSFLGFRGSKEDFSRVLAEKYDLLSKYAEIELHVHLSLFPELLPRDVKEKMISEAVQWGEDHGFKFKKIVFGWWKYDTETLKICEELGLKVVKRGEYPHIHDYDLLYLRKNQLFRILFRTGSTPLLVWHFLIEQLSWIIFFAKNKQIKDYIAECAYME